MKKDFPDVYQVPTGQTSNILFLCNYGLMTGITYDEIASTFVPFGSVTDISLLPGKSYSFLQFSEKEEAEKARETLQGSPINDSNSQVLYLTFVNKLPPVNNPWKDGILPPGLKIIRDFVDQEQENQILADLNWESELKDLKHRQVQHFGYEFQYGSNTINHNVSIRPFPELWSSFTSCSELGEMDQCTVNKYVPGHGIPPHIDTHSCCTETICSLSLGSDIVMNFTTPSNDIIPVYLPRKSLLIMSGESRYIYKHGITPRTSDIVPNKDKTGLTLLKRGTRVSFTFRKVLKGECKCVYPSYCDSQKDAKINLDANKALDLEKLHVHSVYEKIANHFSDTRHTPWEKVVEYLDTIEDGGVLVDIGCGNGKYLGQHPHLVEIGCDYSQGLLNIVRQRHLEGVRSDCLKLPFKDETADAFISIAVIHHLSTSARRRQSIIEMKRILKINGTGLIYTWAKEQVKDSKPSTYLKTKDVDKQPSVIKEEKNIDTSFPLVLPVHTNRTTFTHSDMLVPWKKQNRECEKDNGQTFHRYYHIFQEGELEKLILSIPGLDIVRSYYDQGNWCVIIRKKS